MYELHKFELKDGKLFLDGIRIRGIKAYHLSAKENDNLSELSLTMDVRTLGDDGAPEFDGSADKFRNIRNNQPDELWPHFFPYRSLASIFHKLETRYRKSFNSWH